MGPGYVFRTIVVKNLIPSERSAERMLLIGPEFGLLQTDKIELSSHKPLEGPLEPRPGVQTGRRVAILAKRGAVISDNTEEGVLSEGL